MWAAIAQLIPMVLQMMQSKQGNNSGSSGSSWGGMGVIGGGGGGESKSSGPQYPSVIGGGSGIGMTGQPELFKYQPGSMSSALMNMYNRQRGL
jgi:hypothetical protein